MSSIYDTIRNPYTLNYTWPAWVILPDDGDPFTAQSANLFEKGIDDRNSFVLHALLKLPTSTGSMKAISTNGTSITIYPFNAQLALSGVYYFNPSPSPISIDVSNLEGGGSFANNTWYYVYQAVTMVFGNPFFYTAISTTAPHKYLLYKDNAGAQDLTHKYLFSFITDGAAAIIPFIKNGPYTQYVNSRNLLNAHPGPDFTVVSTATFQPPHSYDININVSCDNGSTDLIVFTVGGHPSESQYSGIFPLNASPRQEVTNIRISTRSQSLLYNEQYFTAGTGPFSLTIDVMGYYE